MNKASQLPCLSLRPKVAAALALMACAVLPAFGATEHWIGVPGVSASINWTDPANWSSPQQTYYNQVQFLGSGMTSNNDFTVNSILDSTTGCAQVPIWELDFTPVNGNYTTLIDPGVTLNLAAGRGYFLVGADQLSTSHPAPSNAVETVTFTGPGAALTMTGTLWVNQGSVAPNDSHNITLDLSGLDNFTMSGGSSSELLVASGGAARTHGTLYLAATNSIDLGNDLQLCNQADSNSVPCAIYLGAQNQILTGTGNLIIGGTGTTAAGAWLKFNPAFLGGSSAPTADLAGSGGDGRIVNFWIGNENGGAQVSGVASCDFSGGNVSVLADSLQLGQAGNPGADITATLTLDNGVVDVNNAIIGHQEVSGGGAGIGIVNLNTNSAYASNATLRVNGPLTLGAVTGTANPATAGTININGGALVAGSLGGGGGMAAVNVTNGSITVSGGAGAPLTALTLVNSSLTLGFSSTAPALAASSLSLQGANVINITGVTPNPSYPVQVPLVKYSGSIGGAFDFTLGSLPALCAGYLSNNVANNSIDLVLTSGPLTSTWTGAVNSDWDTTTPNWSAGGNPVDYADGSFVQFLDGAATGAVNLTTSLSPAGITVSNNALAYTFQGGGALTGAASLLKTGSGSLIMDNSGANSFTGGLDIEAGTLQIGNNDGNGTLPAGAIIDNGVLSFARDDSPAFPDTISGSGAVVQQEAGATLTLSGNNSFTGDVVVTNGSSLKLGSGSALGAGGSAIIADGSTLDANGFSATKTLYVSGAGASDSGALTDTGGAIYDNPGPGLATNIVLTGDATFTYPTRWDLGSANGGSVIRTDGNPRNLTLDSSSGYFEWRNLSVESPVENITIANGNLGVTGSTTFGDPAGVLSIASGASFTLYGADVLVNKGIDFQNGGTINNASGVNVLNGPMTLEAGFCSFNVSGGTTLVLSNTITGPGSLYLNGGTGTTVLSGNSPGLTNVISLYEGQLNLNGAVGGGVTTVSGSTLAGDGRAAGLVDVSGAFFPGGVNATGTFTAAGGLTLESGATVTMDLAPSVSGSNDLVGVTGDLIVNGNNISINPLSGSLAGGSYTLFTYTGNLIGSFGSVSVATASRYSLTLDTSVPHVVKVAVSGVANLLQWNNGSGNGQWDTQSSYNWSNLTTHVEDQFFASDAVLLDDSILQAANPDTTLTIDSGVVVLPSVISNYSTTNFTLAGFGSISGAASIIKAGPSTLAISTTNDFTGDTTVNGGAVQINGQILPTSSPLGLPAGTIFVTNGSTLFVNLTGGYPNGDLGFGAKPLVLSGAGLDGKGAIQNIGNSIYNDSSTLTGLGQSVTLLGDTTIGGSARWDWGYPGLPASLSTRGSNFNFTIIQPGYAQWSDLAIDTNLGNIDYYSTASSQQTWRVAAMGLSLGNPTNTLTLHSNVLMQIAHGDITNGDSGYAKIIHVLPGAAFQFQPSGGAGDFRLATSFIAESNSALAFYNGNGGGGTGTVINGAVTFNGLTHLQIGDSSVTFSNVLDGPGGFYWDNYNNTLVFAAANTYQGPTDIRSGRTLALVGAGSISGSTNISVASSATINVSGRSDQTLALASSQTLQGAGTLAGNLTAGSGSVLAPGGVGAIGTFTVTNNVTLADGALIEMDLNGATNDQVVAASITYGGVLNLNNLGSTLAANQSFKLFNAGSYHGAFATITPASPGAGLTWDLSGLPSGVIRVSSGAGPSAPAIGSISLVGGKLIISGTNASDAAQTFDLLTTTNIALPLSQWTTNATGAFDANGAFFITNNPGTNQAQFYLLKVQ